MSNLTRTLIVLEVVFLCACGPAISQDWVEMSGITDMFYEVKALSGTDTLIVSTAESGMYWTGNVGETWHELPTPSDRITSHEIFRRQGGVEILISLTYDPQLKRSADMGQTWAPASTQMPDLQGHRLILDRYNRLWAFSEDCVYFSDDYGFVWDSVSVAPEVTRVRNLWISPEDSSKLWLAADEAGAYFSADRGQSWIQSFSSGDVHDVEGNPQNHNSAIVVLYEDEMFWNHGDGIWDPLPFPVPGRYGDVVFLDSDSTQLLGIRGYQNHNTTDIIYRSDNGGLSWSLDAGPLITAGAWRIQKLDSGSQRVVVLLNTGALLGDALWEQHQRLYVGSQGGSYRISQHQLALIWGWERGGIYISPDGGLSWICTPFNSAIMNRVEHSARTAHYLIEYDLDLYLLSYPSLNVEELVPVPETTIWLVPSEADSSILYCKSFSGNLYISRDGGHSEWEQIENPAHPDWWCSLCTSSTLPGFALLSTTDLSFGTYPPPSVWRTYDYGESWELVFQTNTGLLYRSWSGIDVLTEYNFWTWISSNSNYKYFYSLDGGESFDSVQTGSQGEGYLCTSWADSVMVVSVDETIDSIYVTPDNFQTLQFRMRFPEGFQTRTFDGKFSQLISHDYPFGATYYYGPNNAIPHHDSSPSVPHDISMSIYPNPTNSSAFIQLSGIIITDPIQIRIYDILGRQTRSFQVRLQSGETTSVPLPINNLASGTYFITIADANMHQPLVQKVVVLK